MADVFISYSKQFRSVTVALANKLEKRGYSVWWDTSLVPAERFRDAILRELTEAKAAIVVWSPASIKSDWVISEAGRAHAQRKLVQVRTANLEPTHIPPPFDVLHCSLVDETERIVEAVAMLVERGPVQVEDPQPGWPLVAGTCAAVSIAALAIWWGIGGWAVGPVDKSAPIGTGPAEKVIASPAQVSPTDDTPAWAQPSGAVKPEMVRIKAGYVETPDGVREFVDEFYIGKTPIKTSEFDTFLENSSYFYPRSSMPVCNSGKPERASQMINCVSWEDANAFAQWGRLQLPTELEFRRALDAARESGSVLFDEKEEWLGEAVYSGRTRSIVSVREGKIRRERDTSSNGRARDDYTFRVVIRKRS